MPRALPRCAVPLDGCARCGARSTGGVMTEVVWQDFPGKRVRIRAPEGSWAAARAPETLRQAERIADALEGLLRPSSGAPRADLYLVDLVGGPPGPGPAGTQGAVLEVASGEPPAAVAWALAPMLLAGWFGPTVMSSEAMVDGIAGVAAARAGTGPTLEEADAWVRESLGSGRTVSVVGGQGLDEGLEGGPGMGGPPPGMDGPPPGFEGGPPPGMDGPPPGFEG